MPRLVFGYDTQGNPVAFNSTPAQDANLASLISKAATALAANATFLAIANPTAAQVATQAKALTRQVDALIRLNLALVDTITDT